MSSRSKYDWVLIEELYIAGKVNPATGENIEWSYAELGKKFKVKNRVTVKEHADKGNWKAKREAYLEKHKQTIRETLRKIDIPSIVEMRKMVLKSQLGTIAKYNQQLDTGEVDVKPVDALRASEFTIDEYNILFGIREQQPEEEPDMKVTLEVKRPHDILRRTSRLIGKTDEGDGNKAE